MIVLRHGCYGFVTEFHRVSIMKGGRLPKMSTHVIRVYMHTIFDICRTCQRAHKLLRNVVIMPIQSLVVFQALRNAKKSLTRRVVVGAIQDKQERGAEKSH